MNPLDIFNLPGPTFLLLYGVALLGAMWLASRLKKNLLKVTPAVPHPQLSVDEMACLIGDRERVIGTALTRMAHRGQVKPTEDGDHFAAAAPLPPDAPALDRTLHQELQRMPRSYTQLSMLDCIALRQIESTLMKGGWLINPQWPAVVRTCRQAALPLLLLACLGAVKIGVGLARGKPVLLLVALVGLTLGSWWLTRRKLPRLTTLAETHIRDLHQRNAALHTTVTRSQSNLSSTDLTLAVALFGTGVLAAGQLGWVHPKGASTDGGGSSGDGGGGGDSSCGGGGGGCGGCGGGGCS